LFGVFASSCYPSFALFLLCLHHPSCCLLFFFLPQSLFTSLFLFILRSPFIALSSYQHTLNQQECGMPSHHQVLLFLTVSTPCGLAEYSRHFAYIRRGDWLIACRRQINRHRSSCADSRDGWEDEALFHQTVHTERVLGITPPADICSDFQCCAVQ
jgi:hypothetical protein